MKYLKKSFALLLSLAMLAALSACGGSSGSSGAAGGLPSEIRIGYWESPNAELLVKETGTLEKLHPDIKVTWI